jgi:transcriptional regulator with PAS, ATPase and Fis domain
MKTLITWLAFNRDFIEKSNIPDPNGFTMSIHRDIYEQFEYKQHIIISTRESNPTTLLKCRSLTQEINIQYPNHSILFKFINIEENDLQNFQVIESKLRSLIASFDAHTSLDVITGTGPTSVPMAFYSLHVAMNKRFSLYLLKDARVSASKRNELVEITTKINPYLDNVLKEHHFNIETPNEIYKDKIIEEEYKKAKEIANAIDINVLILGETGCGKDVMANYIYNKSPLQDKPFRAINCSAIPNDLLYSELFGHEKGAFTSADKTRIGLFEECNGGTIFMDEIGDITPYMQQSLLRALDNKEIKPLGSNTVKKNINIRIISATNNNILEKCKKGEFRWDLYYRLSDIELTLEPFRNRTMADRTKAINSFLQKAELKWGRSITFDKDARSKIYNYTFPGNFRELIKVINGLYSLNIKTITKNDLPKRFFSLDIEDNPEKELDLLRIHYKKLFIKYNKNIAAIAKASGNKNQTQMKEKLKKLGVTI